MDCQLPAPVITFKGGTGGVLGIKAFAEIGRKPPGSGFVAGQAGDGGGCVHAAQIYPSHLRAQWLSRRL